MTLHIGQLSYEIERFNAVLSYDLDITISRLDFTLANTSLDPIEVGEEISEAYVTKQLIF